MKRLIILFNKVAAGFQPASHLAVIKNHRIQLRLQILRTLKGAATLFLLISAICLPSAIYAQAGFTVNAGSTFTLSTDNYTTFEVTGTVTINGTLEAGKSGIKVGERWENNGKFDYGTSTVTLYTATVSTFTGQTTFYCLSCEQGGKELQFTAGTTQWITTTFTMTGASGNNIKLRSTTAGSKWAVTFNSTQTVNYIDVKDSDANKNPVNCVNSVNSGNLNANWVFPAETTPPGPITNLQAGTGKGAGKINLYWTAPGDDNYTGQLISGSKYAIQRSTWTGVSWSTGSVDTVIISTSGVNPGDNQRYTLASLTEGGTYYIRIWTQDEVENNWSSISNGATTWALKVVTYSAGSETNHTYNNVAIDGAITYGAGLEWKSDNLVNSAGTLYERIVNESGTDWRQFEKLYVTWSSTSMFVGTALGGTPEAVNVYVDIDTTQNALGADTNPDANRGYGKNVALSSNGGSILAKSSERAGLRDAVEAIDGSYVTDYWWQVNGDGNTNPPSITIQLNGGARVTVNGVRLKRLDEVTGDVKDIAVRLDDGTTQYITMANNTGIQYLPLPIQAHTANIALTAVSFYAGNGQWTGFEEIEVYATSISTSLPEHVIKMVNSGTSYTSVKLYTYNNSNESWDSGVDLTYAGGTFAQYCEMAIPLTSLNNGSGVPNSVSFSGWLSWYDGVYQYNKCPDDGTFVQVDPDNNQNDIADKEVDTTPPAAISNLTALTFNGNANLGIVKLNWTSPGDDGISNNLTSTCRINYSSVGIVTASNFTNTSSTFATVVNISTTSLVPLTACTTTLFNLNTGTTYWFAIKTADEVSNWSVWNSTADNSSVNTLAYCFMNSSPSAPGTLQQINGNGNILTSMQWTNSSTIISSFTLLDPQSGDRVKFYLHVTSQTSGSNPVWTPLVFATTSGLLTQGTTGYKWPALTSNGTYWWQVWSEDNNGATSSTSTTLGVGGIAKLGFDNTAPAAVTNLTALAGWKVDTVVLRWTSPAGSPANYLMRYSTASFSNSEWDSAWVKNLNTKATLPTPASPGVTEMMLLTGLTNGTSYWFAIKSQDAAGNISDINSNTQDFAVAQTSNPIIINEIAPWQTSSYDLIELYIKNACYVGGLKFYGKDNTAAASGDFILFKTFPTTVDSHWEKELPSGTYIMLYCERTDTDETSVGQSLANTIKIFTTAGTGLRGLATDGREGYCVLSDTAGLTIGTNIMTAGNILDFVAYDVQKADGFADTWDDDNISYAITKGHWISTTSATVPITFDCATAKSIATDKSLARNNSFDKTYNSKYDWSYRATFSTAAANGTDGPTSGVGTCTVSPGTAQISTAGIWKFKYTNASTQSGARHTVVLNIPYGWTQPQTTNGTLAGFTTAYYQAAGEPPQNANFDAGYGAVSSQIIGTNAGWRVVTTIGVMAGSAELYIVYGATYTSTAGQATAPSTTGVYTFRVYSDTSGVNVSEIASSPQITVTETTPPAAISDLTALEGTDDGIVKLNWTSPGDDGVTGNLTGTFRIKYSSVSIISAGNFDSPPSALAVVTVNISTSNLTPLTACTTTMYGLNPGTSYFFAIKTADDVNNWSVWNSSANVLTVNTSAYCSANDSVPPAPPNLVATAGNQQITLTWTAVTGEPDLDFYRIYCDSNPPVAEEWYIVGTTPAVNTSYIHTGLTNNSTYNYRITVVDLGNTASGPSTANESAYSNTVSTAYIVNPPKAALVYFSSSTVQAEYQTPSFRNWDGAAFLSEETTTNMGGQVDKWQVVRMCPQSVRKETIMVTQDAARDINVSTYTANGGWVQNGEFSTDTGGDTYRAFDVAYEQSSGDALVIYRRQTTNTVPYFRTYNGTSWAAESNTGLTNYGSTIQWIRLEPKPGSDEIILVYKNGKGNIYAAVWNGSSFSNEQTIMTDKVSDYTAQPFDVAYSQSAGVGFVVWVATDSTRPFYKTWDGYSWSGAATTSHDHSALGEARWIKAASNPKNNEIMIGTLDNAGTPDLNVEVWSSTLSVWLGGKQISESVRAAGAGTRIFDVGYEKSSGEGIMVYADVSGGAPVGWTWNAGGSGAWASGAALNNTGAATLNWVQFASDDQSDKIHLVTSDADNDINVQTWSGSAWGSITEVETESSNSNESFFCRFPRTAAPADTIAPAAVTSLSGLTVTTSSGTIKLTWSSPGDDVWLGRLTNGCQYRIDYTTSTENRIWYYWTAVSSPTGTDTFAPGTFLSTTLSDLVGDVTYYCKIKYSDGIQWGELSNEATAYASAPILSVDIIETAYNFGEVALGVSSQTNTAIQVKNDGNITENFALRCGTNTAGSPWFSIETSSGADNYLLRAVFHNVKPTMANFADPPAGDIVSDNSSYQVSQTVAGGGRYTVDDSETGVSVPVNATRNLWLRLDMPLTSQTAATQGIILYIRAESPP